jgi:Leucine-rich repeat (LRR) protein
MTEQEFYELLQQIENKTFINTELSIARDPFNEEKIEEKINDQKAIMLANVLKKNSYVTKVNLTGNDIGDIGATALAEVSTLEELNLYSNNIQVEGVVALATSNLKKLSLGGNNIGYDFENKKFHTLTEIADAFAKNHHIIDLSFQCCFLSDEAIVELINKNTSIKALDLISNCLTSECLKFIGNNVGLEKLYLSENDITDEAAKYVMQNTNLKMLWLDKTKITDIGAQLLSTHPTLKELHMLDSEVTINGAQTFIGSNFDKIGVNDTEASQNEHYTFYQEFEAAKLTGNIDYHAEE